VYQVPVFEALRNDAIRDQWAELHEASPDAHAALHPDCVEAWFRDCEAAGGRPPFVHAVMSVRRLECLGVLDSWDLSIAPAMGRVRRGRRLYAKSLLVRGADVPATDALTPDGRNQAAELWLRSLTDGSCSQRVDSLYIEALDRQSQLYQMISESGRHLSWLEPRPLQPRWRIQLPTTVDEYWMSGFSARSRNTLKRKRKKLKNMRVGVFTSAEEVPEYLTFASEVSRHTWQTKQLGLRIRNDDQERRLFSSLAQRGGFRGYVLFVDETPTAFVHLTAHAGVLNNEEMGFLPDWGAFSPGLILQAEVVNDVISAGCFATLDFGLGHAGYKEFLANSQSESEDLWLLQPGFTARLDRRIIQMQNQLTHLAKAALDRAGLLKKLRRRSRGS